MMQVRSSIIQQILECTFSAFDIIFPRAEQRITQIAQQPTNLIGSVAVVNNKIFFRRIVANITHALLVVQHLLVIIYGNAVVRFQSVMLEFPATLWRLFQRFLVFSGSDAVLVNIATAGFVRPVLHFGQAPPLSRAYFTLRIQPVLSIVNNVKISVLAYFATFRTSLFRHLSFRLLAMYLFHYFPLGTVLIRARSLLSAVTTMRSQPINRIAAQSKMGSVQSLLALATLFFGHNLRSASFAAVGVDTRATLCLESAWGSLVWSKIGEWLRRLTFGARLLCYDGYSHFDLRCRLI